MSKIEEIKQLQELLDRRTEIENKAIELISQCRFDEAIELLETIEQPPVEGREAMAKLTPMKAIRQKCLECSCGQIKEVRECNVKTCPLYPYRHGHRPKDEEVITETN